jgi:hypothetical protein
LPYSWSHRLTERFVLVLISSLVWCLSRRKAVIIFLRHSSSPKALCVPPVREPILLFEFASLCPQTERNLNVTFLFPCCLPSILYSSIPFPVRSLITPRKVLGDLNLQNTPRRMSQQRELRAPPSPRIPYTYSGTMASRHLVYKPRINDRAITLMV